MSIPKESARKWLILGARIAVVVVIYFVIFRQIPLSTLRPLMAPALIVAFIAAVLLNVAQAMLCTLRWRVVAANIPNIPNFRKSFAAYMEGLFFNQALPSFIGGDAVRVMRWRAFKVKGSEALLSVFRDRLFGAIGAASFSIIACALLWNQPIERYKLVSLLALSGAVTAGCMLVLALSQWPRLAKLFSRIQSLHKLALELGARPLNNVMIRQSLSISIVAQILPGISVFLLAIALGMNLSMALAISVTGAILLISMIPISLAGWGVREASFLIILVPLGEQSEKALMLGICFGLAGLFGALLGGLSITLGLSAPPASSLQQTQEATKTFPAAETEGSKE